MADLHNKDVCSPRGTDRICKYYLFVLTPTPLSKAGA